MSLKTGIAMLQLVKKPFHQFMDPLGVFSDPKGSGEKGTHDGGAFSGMGAGADFKINAVFLHGIGGNRGLGVVHMRAGDKKRARKNVVVLLICFQLPLAERNIVYFIAPVAVAVGGKGSGEALKHDI